MHPGKLLGIKKVRKDAPPAGRGEAMQELNKKERGLDPAAEKILRLEHPDPHTWLGVHPRRGGKGGCVVRAWEPGAEEGWVIRKGRKPVPMERIHPEGLFESPEIKARMPLRYKLRFKFPGGAEVEKEDPYSFLPTLGDFDLYLFGEGNHQDIWRFLGAHPREHQGVKGTSFAVWAPNAVRVSVVGDFNGWDGRKHPMRVLGSSGIWEIFLPGVGEGALYKFEIKTQAGHLLLKSDPYALKMELRPRTASVVTRLEGFQWGDREWMEERAKTDPRTRPMSIYEVHLGSWRRVPEEGNRWLTYREMAPLLVEHVKWLGFTHIELMPVMEHPLDESWGYQVVGFYAPTSRFGDPDDFRWFVDYCHRNGIGVILDWVPAHFPKDAHGLARFDGTALYEHEDPRLGEHPDWGTLVFNYGRHEVRNFLTANAVYWLDQFHVDGLRVDAVASMLYLDYSRKEGEWIPNRYGGRENLEAIAFLQRTNELVYGRFPGVISVAEESTAWGGVTLPVYLGGLGFGFKWNMGWMHDILEYFSKDPIYRRYHHGNLTFAMLYAWTENFILPLSHDEVVHGKGSLLSKMPGDRWQQLANLRLLYAYMAAQPGKKLLFMGGEFGHPWEWWHGESLPWHLCAYPEHKKLMEYVRDLFHFYRETPALWERDHDPEGFQWVDFHDVNGSVVAFLRKGKDPGDFVFFAFNFTPVPREGYVFGVPHAGPYKEVLNSDSEFYGGSNMGNAGMVTAEPHPSHGFPASVRITLPPLGAVALKPVR